MNIFIHELRSHYKSFLVWAASMVFLIAAGMMKYSAFAKTGDAINEMFKAMPKGLLKAFGVETGTDLTSIGVFYSIFFLYFVLLTAVHSCMLGASIIAKEQRDKTADFLLVKPLKRHQIITPKLLAALVLVVLLNLVTFAASALMVEQYNESGSSLTLPILKLSGALLVIQVLFLAVGLCLGAWAKKAERATGIATAIILGTFLFKILIDMQDNLEKLKFLTPFLYFNSINILYKSEIDLGYLIFSISVSILGGFGAYYFFKKRDIYC